MDEPKNLKHHQILKQTQFTNDPQILKEAQFSKETRITNEDN